MSAAPALASSHRGPPVLSFVAAMAAAAVSVIHCLPCASCWPPFPCDGRSLLFPPPRPPPRPSEARPEEAAAAVAVCPFSVPLLLCALEGFDLRRFECSTIVNLCSIIAVKLFMQD